MAREIDSCIDSNLVIVNTRYCHKDIHKYTRVINTRKKRLIIDYCITERSKGHLITNMCKNVKIESNLLLLEINLKHKKIATIIKPRKRVHEKEKIIIYRIQRKEYGTENHQKNLVDK